MRVNQNGEEVFEDYIFTGNDFSNPEEIGEALLLLAEHIGCQFVRTNATKHGNAELELRLSDEETRTPTHEEMETIKKECKK